MKRTVTIWLGLVAPCVVTAMALSKGVAQDPDYRLVPSEPYPSTVIPNAPSGFATPPPPNLSTDARDRIQPPISNDFHGAFSRTREPVRSNDVRTQSQVSRSRLRPALTLSEERRKLTKDELERIKEVDSLKKQILGSKDDVARKTLGQELNGLLGDIFDEDLHQRDNQLKELEARVKELRDAIEKRRTNRDRIIGLEVEMVMLRAEGLSFPHYIEPPATGPFGWVEWKSESIPPTSPARQSRQAVPALPRYPTQPGQPNREPVDLIPTRKPDEPRTPRS